MQKKSFLLILLLFYNTIDASEQKINFLNQQLAPYKNPQSTLSVSLVEKLAVNYSYQQLIELFEYAHQCMKNNQRASLTIHDIYQACLYINYGDINNNSTPSTKSLKMRAVYHEIGHAFINLENKNRLIGLHVTTQQHQKGPEASFTTIAAYQNKSLNENEITQSIDLLLAGIITQQLFSQPGPYTQDSDLFNGKSMVNKNNILKLLSYPDASSDMLYAQRMVAGLLYLQNQHILDKFTTNDDHINDILVDRYKKTFARLEKSKDKIQQGVDLMLGTHTSAPKNLLDCDELYNLWNMDKPLFEFQEGPLPKSLEHHYEYRSGQ